MNNVKNVTGIKKNYFFNTLYQLSSILIPLITVPYLSRVLGSEAIGTYSFASANVSYFVLFAVFGSTLYGQNHISICRDNKLSLSKTFWEIFLFRLTTTALCISAYLLFLFITKSFNVICLILIFTLVDVPSDISWFFHGLEDFKTILFRGLFTRLVALACVFIFVKNPNDLWLYVLFSTVLPVIANLWTWTNLRGKISLVTNLNIFRNTKEMLSLFIPTIAIQVYMMLDKSLIGFITNSAYQNGCYEQSEKIVRVSLTVITSIGAVILPRVANLYNNGREKEAKDYVYLGFRFTWMLSLPMTMGLLIISNVFVPVFFGPGFDLSITLLPIFSLLIIFVSAAYVSGFSFLIPIGKQNVYTIAVSLSAGLNLILNLFLIPHYGAVGAAIASVIAEFFGVAIQLFYCCNKKLLNWKKIFNSCGKYLIASIIMSICLILIKTYINTTIAGLLIMLISGVSIYALLLIVLRDSFFINTMKNTLSKLKH